MKLNVHLKQGLLLAPLFFLSFSSCNLKNDTKKLNEIKDAIETTVTTIKEESSKLQSATIPDNGLEIPALSHNRDEKILKKKSFTVSFNKKNNIPNWVAWKLDSSKLVERESRSSNFETDPEIPERDAVNTKDYTRSGWDRGHMCPAADNRWHWKAMKESFYMTNVCPQHHNLNRGDWKELEENCRRWVSESKEPVYIVCGPILYKNAKQRFIGNEHKVRVPDAFFKVVLAGVESGKPKAIGFIFKNTNGNHPLDSYVNSIDEVERITGYDFFPQLPDNIENEIESKADIRLWK